jgi:hypothetical protein
MPTTSYSSWDFYNFHVQQDLVGGQFVSAESTLVAAGPPQITSNAAQAGAAGVSQGAVGEVYPIGLLETVGVQQSKQLQRIFEIGSSRSYFVPGRVIGSISVGRTFYFGPSLLRVLYAYYKNTTNSINIGTAAIGTQMTTQGLTVPDPQAQLLAGPTSLHELRRTPGEGYFFIDLASDLFSQPTGMAIYFKDANFISIGAIYLENCYVQGHQLNISSGSVLVMEGVSLQYDRIVPIKVL